jgi:hypothetical protein
MYIITKRKMQGIYPYITFSQDAGLTLTA